MTMRGEPHHVSDLGMNVRPYDEQANLVDLMGLLLIIKGC
jgi:hypothetical protein